MVRIAHADPQPGTGDFQHSVLFYTGVAGFLKGTLPLVMDGASAGEPVLVAAPTDRIDALRAALPAMAADVRFLDMAEAGRNPGRILPTVLLPFAREHPGRRVRVISEPIWAERTALEYPVCVEQEALINTAFRGKDATILCPYDETALRSAVIEDARTTHPYVRANGAVSACAEYADPDTVVASRNRPLGDPPAYAVTLTVTVDGLSGVHRAVAEQAYAAGVPASRADEVADAVHELAFSRMRLTRQTALGLWAESSHFVCQVSDPGPPTDHHAVWEPSRDWHGDGARGLLRVHQLADLVRSSTAPGRSAVRAYFRK
jgi:hypothetical protein